MPNKIPVPRNNGPHPHTLSVSATDDPKGLKRFLKDFTPLFIHQNDDGEDQVRGAIPTTLIPGLVDVECPCCGSKCQRSPDGSLLMLDIELQEIDWHITEDTAT